MFIWRSLLQLPENHAAFCSLVDKGTHSAYVRLHEHYPIKSRKLLRVLQRLTVKNNLVCLLLSFVCSFVRSFPSFPSLPFLPSSLARSLPPSLPASLPLSFPPFFPSLVPYLLSTHLIPNSFISQNPVCLGSLVCSVRRNPLPSSTCFSFCKTIPEQSTYLF